MAKAIFTTKVMPGYNDLPEAKYHFPRTYLNQVRQAVSDHIIYYEPRRTSVELSSTGGRQCYFGVARVTAIVQDTELPDHYYALIADYLDFDQPVPFAEGSELRKCFEEGRWLHQQGCVRARRTACVGG